MARPQRIRGDMIRAFAIVLLLLLGTPACLVGGIGLLARRQMRHLDEPGK